MQSLVDAAGEALGILEDPLLTDVGLKVMQLKIQDWETINNYFKVDEATRDELDKEDVELNMEICELVSSTEGGPLQAIRAVKRR